MNVPRSFRPAKKAKVEHVTVLESSQNSIISQSLGGAASDSSDSEQYDSKMIDLYHPQDDHSIHESGSTFVDEEQPVEDVPSTMPVFAPTQLAHSPPIETVGDDNTTYESQLVNCKHEQEVALDDSVSKKPSENAKDDVNLRPAATRGVRFASVAREADIEAEDYSSSGEEEAGEITVLQGTATNTSSQTSRTDQSQRARTSKQDRVTTSEAGPTSSLNGFYRFDAPPPTLFALLEDLDAHKLPHKIYDDAYWSNEAEVPSTFEFAGRRIPHRSHTERFLQEFRGTSLQEKSMVLPKLPITGFRCWEYSAPLPYRQAILDWKPDGGDPILGKSRK